MAGVGSKASALLAAVGAQMTAEEYVDASQVIARAQTILSEAQSWRDHDGHSFLEGHSAALGVAAALYLASFVIQEIPEISVSWFRKLELESDAAATVEC